MTVTVIVLNCFICIWRVRWDGVRMLPLQRRDQGKCRIIYISVMWKDLKQKGRRRWRKSLWTSFRRSFNFILHILSTPHPPPLTPTPNPHPRLLPIQLYFLLHKSALCVISLPGRRRNLEFSQWVAYTRTPTGRWLWETCTCRRFQLGCPAYSVFYCSTLFLRVGERHQSGYRVQDPRGDRSFHSSPRVEAHWV